MIRVKDWAIIKNTLNARQVPCDWVNIGHAYWIMVVDAYFQMEMFLPISDPASADQIDFETNYRDVGNVSKTDIEGNLLSRPKASRKGWHFQKHFISIKTSTASGFFNKDHLGNDLGFVTYKMFDVNDVETVVPANCVKTQVDWMPGHDMEVIGGGLCQSSAPVNDVRIWVIAAPGLADIPFLQGGVNLKLVGSGGNVDADGKASKFLKYNDPIPGTNTFRILCEHNAADVHEFQIGFDLFKE